MKSNLFNKFCSINPEFLVELNLLSNINKLKFKGKFSNEDNEVNFLSTLSEFRFAQFLELEKVDYEYEPKIYNKQPDFKIILSKNNIIYFDVKRFNISDNDRKNNDILYELSSKLSLIQKPYGIDIKQLSSSLNFDVDLVFEKVENWLNKSDINPGDALIIDKMLKITVFYFNGKNKNLIFGYSSLNPKIHPNKIKSDLLRKIESYKKSIIEKELPFFIAIDLISDTLKEPIEYWNYFLGKNQICNNGNHSFQLGEFYNDFKFDNLVGLLIRYCRKFYWLKNPRNHFDLNFKNIEIEN